MSHVFDLKRSYLKEEDCILAYSLKGHPPSWWGSQSSSRKRRYDHRRQLLRLISWQFQSGSRKQARSGYQLLNLVHSKAPPPTRSHLHNLLPRVPPAWDSTTFRLQRRFHIQTTKVIIFYINKSMSTIAGQHRGMSTCLQIQRISLGEHTLHSSFFPSHHCPTNGLFSLLTEASIYLSCLDLCFLTFLWILKSN